MCVQTDAMLLVPTGCSEYTHTHNHKCETSAMANDDIYYNNTSRSLVHPDRQYAAVDEKTLDTFKKEQEEREANLRKSEQYRAVLDNINNILMNKLFQSGGMSYETSYSKLLTRFDRFQRKFYTPNQVYSGFTFITRPRLALTSSNLRSYRFLQYFNTLNPQSIQFAIRCMLDTKFTDPTRLGNKAIANCPYFDYRNPFLAILTNTVQEVSGLPDQQLRSYTTNPGYYQEDMRFAIGSDRNNKSFDFNMTFTDPEGGMVDTLFQLWITFVDLLTSGECIPYIDDLYYRRLCYTVSVYRFVVDPSTRFLVKWVKLTGCYPFARNSGAAFEVNRSNKYVDAARNITIQFVCNKYEENDWIIPIEFNTLVKRYCSDIDNDETYKIAPLEGEYNFVGLPYINTSVVHRPILEFRYRPNPSTTNLSDRRKHVAAVDRMIDNAQKAYGYQTPDVSWLS